ncbi:hypothetical protein GGF32_005195 [Allomyces javanicus]|nr:hypothetical protein GGF32_005195 [Allomyces javanicus]
MDPAPPPPPNYHHPPSPWAPAAASAPATAPAAPATMTMADGGALLAQLQQAVARQHQSASQHTALHQSLLQYALSHAPTNPPSVAHATPAPTPAPAAVTSPRLAAAAAPAIGDQDHVTIMFALRAPATHDGTHPYPVRVCEPVVLAPPDPASGGRTPAMALSLVETLMQAHSTMPLAGPTIALVRNLLSVTPNLTEIVRGAGGVATNVPSSAQWHLELMRRAHTVSSSHPLPSDSSQNAPMSQMTATAPNAATVQQAALIHQMALAAQHAAMTQHAALATPAPTTTPPAPPAKESSRRDDAAPPPPAPSAPEPLRTGPDHRQPRTADGPPGPDPSYAADLVHMIGNLTGATASDMSRRSRRWERRFDQIFGHMIRPQFLHLDEDTNTLSFWVPRFPEAVAEVMGRSGLVVGGARFDFEPADANDLPPPDLRPPERDVYVLVNTPNVSNFANLLQAMRSHGLFRVDADLNYDMQVPGCHLPYGYLSLAPDCPGRAENLDGVFRLNDAKAVFADPARLDKEIRAMGERVLAEG